MCFWRARHGENLAAPVFVLFGLLGFLCEVGLATGLVMACSGGACRCARIIYVHATKLPDFPPCFSSTRTPVITMRLSAALHMS